MTDKELPRLISPKELKEYLGCNDRTLYNLLQSEDFPSFRIGRRYYIIYEEFLAWLKEKQHSDRKKYY